MLIIAGENPRPPALSDSPALRVMVNQMAFNQSASMCYLVYFIIRNRKVLSAFPYIDGNTSASFWRIRKAV